MKAVHEAFNGSQRHSHFVQFYKADEPLLNRNVANFLWDGLLRGDGLLVVAGRQRRESVAGYLTRLGADVPMAEREGQLVMFDAHEMLSRFMLPGAGPDWECFQEAIGELLELPRARIPHAGIQVYGEMVGLLWEEGRRAAAIQLEEYWNHLLHRGGIRLFCGYPIDVFGREFHQAHVQDVLRVHTHVLPTAANGDLSEVLERAMQELLGAQAQELRSSMAAAPVEELVMPDAERSILWLRSHIPDRADEILSRARGYYASSHPKSMVAGV